jgi:hypothetical protein
LWKRIANGHLGTFSVTVATGDHGYQHRAALLFRRAESPAADQGMTPVNREHNRIAYCECGAQLQGDSEQELLDAAQAHLAHHHPELLGAVGLDVAAQMAEERPGAINA